MTKLFITAIAIAFSTFTSIAQTTEEIVAKHIEAIGGKDNWAKIKSMRSEGIIKAQGAEIKITNTQIDKKANRTDIEVMGMKGYSILTKTEGWNFMPFQGQTKPEPITADELKMGQDELNIQDEFLTYTALGKKIENLGKDEVDGTECFKIKLIDKEGIESTYFIDQSNYFTIKEINKVKVNGQEMENTTTYSNYKKTDTGVFIAMSIGSDFGDLEISKIDINPSIDESIFKLAK
jgi:hypothetical protein